MAKHALKAIYKDSPFSAVRYCVFDSKEDIIDFLTTTYDVRIYSLEQALNKSAFISAGVRNIKAEKPDYANADIYVALDYDDDEGLLLDYFEIIQCK